MGSPTIIPLLPSSLMNIPWIAAFDALIRNYISDDNDLNIPGPILETVINILNIDTVESSVLPYLAWMFGVDGYKGFDYATTDLQQRNMIKNAMKKHECHGTLWTLTTALTDAGYQNIIIDDHLYTLFINGQWTIDGQLIIPSNSWADFTVTLNPPVGVLPQNVDVTALIKYINYWKRGSSRLVDLTVANIIFSNLNIGGSISTGPRVIDGTWTIDGVYIIGT